nr:MAG TPA: hypothetical protein [Caudoviricetes sp.]
MRLETLLYKFSAFCYRYQCNIELGIVSLFLL